MSTITALDLTKDYPRSPLIPLGGFPWLARMIDKTRALNAGKLGEYKPFPCGGDQTFLGAYGVDAAAFKAKVDGGASDDEIVTWFTANHVANGEAIATYGQRMLTPITDPEYLGYLEGSKAELAAARPELDVAKVTNFAQLICLEEGHACPGL
ncbi:MAG: DUF5069 domain-containing protein [Candidatus Sericytochromatia bacterium]|nr:DUF5069 domain-containing protein [Candidatus Sericytochromatia bacterium]